MKAPKRFSSKTFSDPQKACTYIQEIYNTNINFLRAAFDDFTYDRLTDDKRIAACYPYIRFETKSSNRMDSRLSYGFVPHPGVFQTTVTRPEIFSRYYTNMMELLINNHGGKVEIGVSSTSIPIHFALGEDFHLEKDLGPKKLATVPQIFDQPDLMVMDDEIANSTYTVKPGEPHPLSLFTGPRVDVSLMRLKHYTGTRAEHFQNYVLFTNYQFYIDQFIKLGRERVGQGGYTDFIEADSEKRLPQMPAYHLKRENGSGITMVNIGVGPSNAKTITDHIAVLRPHAWLMLGHCAGLRNSQSLGDYVLAHGYLREDNVLYKDLHPSIPLPALAEIQLSLEQAVSEVTGYQGYELKKIMRTGTVATIDDRNWELRPSVRQNMRFSQSRAIALDMESGTIAANGFRFRVPYGTLLCVSDKPLHGQLKLPGMADSFYRERVEQHLKIGLRTMEILREFGPEKLHSRKLRSFNEVAFQ